MEKVKFCYEFGVSCLLIFIESVLNFVVVSPEDMVDQRYFDGHMNPLEDRYYHRTCGRGGASGRSCLY